MKKALAVKKETVHITEVVRHGEQFFIPDGMSIDDAIKALMKLKVEEEQTIDIIEKIDCLIFDGAYAFALAMEQKFGYAIGVPIPQPGLFGPGEPILPASLQVEIGFEKTVSVPWGRFNLPGIDGFVEVSYQPKKKSRFDLLLTANVKKKHEKQVRELFALAKEIIKEKSIYKSQAVRLRLRNNAGQQLEIPEPKFMDLSKVREDEIIFQTDIKSSIETNLFTPIEKSEACKNFKIPLKRGILLSGPYGVGKTLLTYITAYKATKNGWTFLYCERADELAEMVQFARQYQPCVIFCEDVDRVMDGERSVSMDDILNVIDGIESKSTEIMVVLTTNNVEKIHRAMLRPGRLDAVINLRPPDSEAVQKLVRLYGRGLVSKNADLKGIGKALEGQIPAVIRECVERAKLSAIKVGSNMELTEAVLMDAALGMENQLDLLKEKQIEKKHEIAGRMVGEFFTRSMEKMSINGN